MKKKTVYVIQVIEDGMLRDAWADCNDEYDNVSEAIADAKRFTVMNNRGYRYRVISKTDEVIKTIRRNKKENNQ